MVSNRPETAELTKAEAFWLGFLVAVAINMSAHLAGCSWEPFPCLQCPHGDTCK